MGRERGNQGVVATPEAATPRPRTFGDACIDAVPDAVACGACALAWAKPQAVPGLDLVGWAAPLFLVQIPLSMIAIYTGVARLSDAAMPRRTKAGFVLAPTLAMALLAPIVLGPAALVAVLLLSATTLWRIARGELDHDAPVRGAWITYTQGMDDDGRPRRAWSAQTGTSGTVPQGRVRQWRVEAGHAQVMAVVTATAGILLVAVLAVVDVQRIGVTPAIEAASAWSRTTLGGMVGAHDALAGGVALFAARCLLQFEGIAPKPGSPEARPIPRIEDDPVLRDIVRKVDRGARK